MPPLVAFCRSIDYADTASLHDDKTMKQLMTDMVKLMMQSDSISTVRALEVFFSGIGNDTISIRSASRYADLFLNNPESPVRDETLYIQFLEILLRTPDLTDDVAERSNEQIRKAKLNRPGTVASDFKYIDRNGNKGSLHALQAKQTLLVFYDPECPHCPEILEKIATDSELNSAIETGTLKVLAVYAEGKRNVWDKTKKDLPKAWNVAYDLTGILDNDLYDLPAMPTVYLLDPEKRVLIKDMPW